MPQSFEVWCSLQNILLGNYSNCLYSLFQYYFSVKSASVNLLFKLLRHLAHLLIILNFRFHFPFIYNSQSYNPFNVFIPFHSQVLLSVHLLTIGAFSILYPINFLLMPRVIFQP